MTDSPTTIAASDFFEINNRWTGSVQFSCEIGAEFAGKRYGFRLGIAIKKAYMTDANLRGANLTDADLRGADLTRADLRGANLTDAVLTRAVLTRADLTGADLTRAVLTRADLTGADLTRAVLTDAVLTDADLTDANLTDADLTRADLRDADIPIVPNIDAAILAQVEGEASVGSLDMSSWHTCKTTHCRAGWAITLAGDAGKALEKRYGSAAAGALIYAISRPGKPIPNFYATNEDALEDLRQCADRAKDVPC